MSTHLKLGFKLTLCSEDARPGYHLRATNNPIHPVGVPARDDMDTTASFENCVFQIITGYGDVTDDVLHRRLGEDIVYGQVARLLHVPTKSLLCVSRHERAHLEKPHHKISLETLDGKDSEDLRENSRWRILPRYKVRSEGQKIQDKDVIVLQNVADDSYLHIAASNLSRGDVYYREANAAPSLSAFHVIFFDNLTAAIDDGDDSDLRLGDCIQLFHRQHASLLSADLSDELPFLQPFGVAAEDEMDDFLRYQIDHEMIGAGEGIAGTNNMKLYPSTSLFVVEKDNSLTGGAILLVPNNSTQSNTAAGTNPNNNASSNPFLTPRHLFRIRNVSTGKYLAMRKKQQKEGGKIPSELKLDPTAAANVSSSYAKKSSSSSDEFDMCGNEESNNNTNKNTNTNSSNNKTQEEESNPKKEHTLASFSSPLLSQLFTQKVDDFEVYMTSDSNDTGCKVYFSQAGPDINSTICINHSRIFICFPFVSTGNESSDIYEQQTTEQKITSALWLGSEAAAETTSSSFSNLNNNNNNNNNSSNTPSQSFSPMFNNSSFGFTSSNFSAASSNANANNNNNVPSFASNSKNIRKIRLNSNIGVSQKDSLEVRKVPYEEFKELNCVVSLMPPLKELYDCSCDIVERLHETDILSASTSNSGDTSALVPQMSCIAASVNKNPLFKRKRTTSPTTSTTANVTHQIPSSPISNEQQQKMNKNEDGRNSPGSIDLRYPPRHLLEHVRDALSALIILITPDSSERNVLVRAGRRDEYVQQRLVDQYIIHLVMDLIEKLSIVGNMFPSDSGITHVVEEEARNPAAMMKENLDQQEQKQEQRKEQEREESSLLPGMVSSPPPLETATTTSTATNNNTASSSVAADVKFFSATATPLKTAVKGITSAAVAASAAAFAGDTPSPTKKSVTIQIADDNNNPQHQQQSQPEDYLSVLRKQRQELEQQKELQQQQSKSSSPPRRTSFSGDGDRRSSLPSLPASMMMSMSHFGKHATEEELESIPLMYNIIQLGFRLIRDCAYQNEECSVLMGDLVPRILLYSSHPKKKIGATDALVEIYRDHAQLVDNPQELSTVSKVLELVKSFVRASCASVKLLSVFCSCNDRGMRFAQDKIGNCLLAPSMNNVPDGHNLSFSVASSSSVRGASGTTTTAAAVDDSDPVFFRIWLAPDGIELLIDVDAKSFYQQLKESRTKNYLRRKRRKKQEERCCVDQQQQQQTSSATTGENNFNAFDNSNQQQQHQQLHDTDDDESDDDQDDQDDDSDNDPLLLLSKSENDDDDDNIDDGENNYNINEENAAQAQQQANRYITLQEFLFQDNLLPEIGNNNNLADEYRKAAAAGAGAGTSSSGSSNTVEIGGKLVPLPLSMRITPPACLLQQLRLTAALCVDRHAENIDDVRELFPLRTLIRLATDFKYDGEIRGAAFNIIEAAYVNVDPLPDLLHNAQNPVMMWSDVKKRNEKQRKKYESGGIFFGTSSSEEKARKNDVTFDPNTDADPKLMSRDEEMQRDRVFASEDGQCLLRFIPWLLQFLTERGEMDITNRPENTSIEAGLSLLRSFLRFSWISPESYYLWLEALTDLLDGSDDKGFEANPELRYEYDEHNHILISVKLLCIDCIGIISTIARTGIVQLMVSSFELGKAPPHLCAILDPRPKSKIHAISLVKKRESAEARQLFEQQQKEEEENQIPIVSKFLEARAAAKSGVTSLVNNIPIVGNSSSFFGSTSSSASLDNFAFLEKLFIVLLDNSRYKFDLLVRKSVTLFLELSNMHFSIQPTLKNLQLLTSPENDRFYSDLRGINHELRRFTVTTIAPNDTKTILFLINAANNKLNETLRDMTHNKEKGEERLSILQHMRFHKVISSIVCKIGLELESEGITKQNENFHEEQDSPRERIMLAGCLFLDRMLSSPKLNPKISTELQSFIPDFTNLLDSHPDHFSPILRKIFSLNFDVCRNVTSESLGNIIVAITCWSKRPDISHLLRILVWQTVAMENGDGLLTRNHRIQGKILHALQHSPLLEKTFRLQDFFFGRKGLQLVEHLVASQNYILDESELVTRLEILYTLVCCVRNRSNNMEQRAAARHVIFGQHILSSIREITKLLDGSPLVGVVFTTILQELFLSESSILSVVCDNKQVLYGILSKFSHILFDFAERVEGRVPIARSSRTSSSGATSSSSRVKSALGVVTATSRLESTTRSATSPPSRHHHSPVSSSQRQQLTRQEQQQKQRELKEQKQQRERTRASRLAAADSFEVNCYNALLCVVPCLTQMIHDENFLAKVDDPQCIEKLQELGEVMTKITASILSKYPLQKRQVFVDSSHYQEYFGENFDAELNIVNNSSSFLGNKTHRSGSGKRTSSSNRNKNKSSSKYRHRSSSKRKRSSSSQRHYNDDDFDSDSDQEDNNNSGSDDDSNSGSQDSDDTNSISSHDSSDDQRINRKVVKSSRRQHHSSSRRRTASSGRKRRHDDGKQRFETNQNLSSLKIVKGNITATIYLLGPGVATDLRIPSSLYFEETPGIHICPAIDSASKMPIICLKRLVDALDKLQQHKIIRRNSVKHLIHKVRNIRTFDDVGNNLVVPSSSNNSNKLLSQQHQIAAAGSFVPATASSAEINDDDGGGGDNMNNAPDHNKTPPRIISGNTPQDNNDNDNNINKKLTPQQQIVSSSSNKTPPPLILGREDKTINENKVSSSSARGTTRPSSASSGSSSARGKSSSSRPSSATRSRTNVNNNESASRRHHHQQQFDKQDSNNQGAGDFDMVDPNNAFAIITGAIKAPSAIAAAQAAATGGAGYAAIDESTRSTTTGFGNDNNIAAETGGGNENEKSFYDNSNNPFRPRIDETLSLQDKWQKFVERFELLAEGTREETMFRTSARLALRRAYPGHKMVKAVIRTLESPHITSHDRCMFLSFLKQVVEVDNCSNCDSVLVSASPNIDESEEWQKKKVLSIEMEADERRNLMATWKRGALLPPKIVRLINLNNAKTTKAALQCGIAILDRGNDKMQASLMEYFLSTNRETFFAVCRTYFSRARDWIIERAALISDENSSSSGGGGSSSSDNFSSNNKFDFSVVKLLLRFLQLCCEGHYTAMQNYIRYQEDNTVSINILESMMALLDTLVEKKVDDHIFALARNTLDTLTEAIQGPCLQNQKYIISQNAGGIVTTLFSEAGKCLSEENEKELLRAGMMLLLSLLEGHTDATMISMLLQTMTLRPFVEIMDETHSGWDSEHNKGRRVISALFGVEDDGEMEVASSSNNTTAGAATSSSSRPYHHHTDNLMSVDTANENDSSSLWNDTRVFCFDIVSDCFDEFSQIYEGICSPPLNTDELNDELNLAILIYVFLCSVLDVEHLFITSRGGDVTDPSQMRFKDKAKSNVMLAFRKSKSLRELADVVATIEILRHGKVERCYFRIPEVCRKNLQEATKKQFIDEVNRSGDGARLADTFSKYFVILDSLETLDNMRRTRGLSLVYHYIEIIENLAFLVAFIVNIIMIAQSEYVYAENNDAHLPADGGVWIAFQTFGILLMVLQSLLFTYFFFGELQIYINSQWSDWQDKLNNDRKHTNMKNLNIRGPDLRDDDKDRLSRAQVLYHSVIFALQYSPLYKYAIFCSFSYLSFFLSPMWYCFQPLQVVWKSPQLYNVVESIIINKVNLSLTFVLLLVVINVFSTFGYYIFSDLFDAENFGEAGNCDTMLRCFTTTLHYGLKSGGGLGDVSSFPIYTTQNPGKYFARIIFEFLFFLILIIMALNLVFGIVLDAFSSLREERDFVDQHQDGFCFVCGIDRDSLDKIIGFEQHIKFHHNMWQYLFFMKYLTMIDESNHTGQEGYVWKCMQDKDPRWFPIQRSTITDFTSSHETDGSIKKDLLLAQHLYGDEGGVTCFGDGNAASSDNRMQGGGGGSGSGNDGGGGGGGGGHHDAGKFTSSSSSEHQQLSETAVSNAVNAVTQAAVQAFQQQAAAFGSSATVANLENSTNLNNTVVVLPPPSPTSANQKRSFSLPALAAQVARNTAALESTPDNNSAVTATRGSALSSSSAAQAQAHPTAGTIVPSALSDLSQQQQQQQQHINYIQQRLDNNTASDNNTTATRIVEDRLDRLEENNREQAKQLQRMENMLRETLQVLLESPRTQQNMNLNERK